MQRIIPFHAEHLNLLEPQENDPVLSFPEWRERVGFMCGNGVAFSLVCDGRLVCCGGMVTTNPGVGVVWMLPSRYVNDYALAVTRKVKEVLEDLAATHQLHRLETSCHDNLLYERWMGYLGFEKEGVQRKGGINRADVIMYGRLL